MNIRIAFLFCLLLGLSACSLHTPYINYEEKAIVIPLSYSCLGAKHFFPPKEKRGNVGCWRHDGETIHSKMSTLPSGDASCFIVAYYADYKAAESIASTWEYIVPKSYCFSPDAKVRALLGDEVLAHKVFMF